MPLEVHRFPVGEMLANCFLLVDEATNEAALVDPGDRSDIIQNYISIYNFKISHILLTHAHFDHIFGCGFFKSLYPHAKILVHLNEIPIWAGNDEFAQMFGQKAPDDYLKEPDGTFSEGEIIKIGETSLEVVLTPGHTPGSVCFIDKDDKIAITGDTLFAYGRGRTSFSGGNLEQMRDSIAKLKNILSDQYEIYPGHGCSTKSGRAIIVAEKMI
ncbi:Hydroxyacylglutathione_hydrolase [Hexamita inflata]|uniref:Hydroxyacylglutathione hydrolase n=1 Tax=Hexamita inflata TaxID=28002 RepID=A0AA86PYU7_9EUKA|nr:Hydroxyacylglutathione hydrolase [Hexamita inflata]